MEQKRDDQIRDLIMELLHLAYRKPKGKWMHPTHSVITHEVREKIPVEREDISRELKYLEVNDWIKEINKTERPLVRGAISFTMTYYELSRRGIDLFETPGKYSRKDVGWATKIPSVNIQGTINAPITIGNSNTVYSYNTSRDVAKLIELIDNKFLIDEEKVQLKKIINEDLEPLLKNPNLEQSKTFLDKLKSIGQIWIAPIITQLIAAYLMQHLGFPPSTSLNPQQLLDEINKNIA